jgi:hypothetical protein
MIKLVLHLIFTKDIPNKEVQLVMDAPQLPDGVMWHKGMYFVPNPQNIYDHGHEVGAVYLMKDKVEVHFFVDQTCLFNEEFVDEFLADGWIRRELASYT